MPDLSEDQQAALDEARAKAAEETGAKVIEHPSSKELVQRGAVTIEPTQTWWSDRQIAALQAVGLEDVPQEHLMAFLHICQRSGLDPFSREIYYIGRKDNKAPGGVRYTAQTGIDGYRRIAERTGEYDGREGPWWCGPDGEWHEVWLDDNTPPVAARVAIYRKGMTRPVMATALYREFVPMQDKWEGPKGNRRKTGEQEPGSMWRKMPAHMLAKCAEALAIRQAFPAEAGSIYTEDEMGVADQRAREQAEAVRAEQRRELVGFSGPGAKATPAETAEGEVVDGEVVVELDRDALDAELEAQAKTLDKSVAQHATRWAAVHHKNITDATDEELEAFLESQRARVAEKRAQLVADGVDVVAETTVIPDDGEQDALPMSEPDVDPDSPHPYQDWSGVCIVCSKTKADPLHEETE